MATYTTQEYGANGALVKSTVVDSTAGTLTVFNGAGQQQSTRPLTPAEVAQYAAQDAAATETVNQSSFQQKLAAALAANQNDVAQDQAIITQSATITAASITNLATAATAIAKLAQAVSILAGNDINTKKELQALVRLVLQQYDSTSGT